MGLAACGDYASLTDVRPPTEVLVDLLPPVITLRAPEQALEEGESLVATITDDVRVSVAVAYLLDQQRKILWRSDTIQVGRDSADVHFPLTGLPSGFPFGQEVLYTAWARDASGKERFAGTVSVAEAQAPVPASTLNEAEVEPVTIAFGRTFSLGEGVSFGGMAYDAFERMVYLTVPSRNEVRGLSLAPSLSAMKIAGWRIPVGSRPNLIAFQRYAWGMKPVLAVFNDGGLDVSVVDLSDRGLGGTERWRVQIPLIRVTIDDMVHSIQPRASSILIHCPDDFCHDPVLYLASPAADNAARVAVRSLAIADPDPNADFSIFAPAYTGIISEDQPVTIQAWAVDPNTGNETPIFGPVVASRCGALAIGTTMVATTERLGGDLFLIEDGKARGACGGSGRVLRFSRDNFGPYYISTPAVINYDFDPALAGVSQVAVNADGSLVLLRAGERVFVTTGDLRRLGTIEVQGASAIAFLEQQTDGPGHGSNGALFAVAARDGIHVFEAAHFTEVKHFPTARGFGSELLFLRRDDGDRLLILGFTENNEGLLILETRLSELRGTIQH